jgi:hypothetical protein
VEVLTGTLIPKHFHLRLSMALSSALNTYQSYCRQCVHSQQLISLFP